MARLKSHGVELLRLEREYEIDSDAPGKKTKYHEILSYRSDGKILRRTSSFFEATAYQKAYWHTWGWKLYKSLRPGVDPQAHISALREKLISPDSNSVYKDCWRVR